MVTYNPTSNWRCFADASPDCTGDKAIEVRLKGSAKKPASESKVFTFTADADTAEKKYISVDYLTMEAFSTESQDTARPNYAVNAIDGNANTYWHTDYTIDIKHSVQGSNKTPIERVTPFLTIKLDAPTWLSALEFSQRQYNSAFSIFAKKVTVYVSEDGVTWTKAGERKDLENMANLNVINFGTTDEETGELLESKSFYGQYVKLELTELYETNTNDGVYTTMSLVNLYEDTTKTKTPDGKPMESLSELTPGKDSAAGLGEVIKEEDIAGEKLIEDEPFEWVSPYTPKKSNAGLWIALAVVAVVLIGGGVAAVFFMKRKKATATGNNAEKDSKTKASATDSKVTAAAPKASTAAPKTSATDSKVTAAAPKASTTAPKVISATPKASTAAPKASTAAPKASTAAPKASTTTPKTSTAAPKASATAPKTSTTAPKASTTDPKANATKPKK